MAKTTREGVLLSKTCHPTRRESRILLPQNDTRRFFYNSNSNWFDLIFYKQPSSTMCNTPTMNEDLTSCSRTNSSSNSRNTGIRNHELLRTSFNPQHQQEVWTTRTTNRVMTRQPNTTRTTTVAETTSLNQDLVSLITHVRPATFMTTTTTSRNRRNIESLTSSRLNTNNRGSSNSNRMSRLLGILENVERILDDNLFDNDDNSTIYNRIEEDNNEERKEGN